MDETKEIEQKVESIEKDKRFKRESLFIHCCLIIGGFCICSRLFKAWLSNVIHLDWFILGMGVALYECRYSGNSRLTKLLLPQKCVNL